MVSEEKLTQGYAFIVAHINKTGMSPSVREIARGAGGSSSRTGLAIVCELEHRGLIRRDMTRNRRITLVDRT